MNNNSIQIESYSKLFEIENIFRVSMHNVLISKFGVNYLENIRFQNEVLARFSTELFGKVEDINLLRFKKRMDKESTEFNTLIEYNFPFFWYLDLGPLLAIYYEKNIEFFSEIFDCNNEMIKFVKQSAGDLRNARNSVAHNRFIGYHNHAIILSHFKITNNLIKTCFINNYDQLVFTENYNSEIVLKNATSDLITLVKRGSIINKNQIDNLKSILSAVMQTAKSSEFLSRIELLLPKIEEYNGLKRKPGNFNEILVYVKSSGLLYDLTEMQIKGI